MGAVVRTPEDPLVGFPNPRVELACVNGPHSQKEGAWNLMWQNGALRDGAPRPALVCEGLLQAPQVAKADGLGTGRWGAVSTQS